MEEGERAGLLNVDVPRNDFHACSESKPHSVSSRSLPQPDWKGYQTDSPKEIFDAQELAYDERALSAIGKNRHSHGPDWIKNSKGGGGGKFSISPPLPEHSQQRLCLKNDVHPSTRTPLRS